MLAILALLVGSQAFPAFNREPGVDPQRFRGFHPRSLKLSQLGIGGREPNTSPLRIGQARYAFAEPPHRLPIALEHVIGLAHIVKSMGRLKRVKTHVCLEYLDRPCGLARVNQGSGVSIVDEIGIKCEGSLEFGDRGVVLTLVKQDMSKLSASLWQAGVEAHR